MTSPEPRQLSDNQAEGFMPNKVKVLIVDDKPENLLALERVLRPIGVKVVAAASGNEALAKLLDDEFACILLDVQMPGMDGFEAASIIRNDPKLSCTPILFVTAHSAAKAEVFKGYELGAVDYLLKPLEPEIVRGKVAVFVALFRQRQTIERQASQLAAVNLELKRSNEELDQFTSVAAHDLKSPLATLVHAVETVAEMAADRLTEHEAYFLARSGVISRSLLNLIDDLLKYAHFGRGEIAMVDVDCNAVVNTVLTHVKDLVDQSDAQVVVAHLPVVAGDSGLLYHLFQNLIGNALKYRRPGVRPLIEIGAEREDDSWRLWIKDNGVGIEPEHQDLIFEPFRRAPNSKEPGTGIGLALCQRIVDRHHGHIWVESTPAAGSTFFVTLKNPTERPTPEFN